MSLSARRRVVITGVGLTSPIGNSLDEVALALRTGRTGVTTRPEWADIEDLRTLLCAPVSPEPTLKYPRKKVRTMGRLGLLSVFSTEAALAMADLAPEALQAGTAGLAYGSTHGSSSELEAFCRTVFGGNTFRGVSPRDFLKFMSHTTAANLAQFYGIRGRIITTNSACTSASQAIGYGAEAIRFGLQDVMICGGAEELHWVPAGVFDLLYATSTGYNESPERSPRPFDKDRDGLVIGEGAGTLVLESLQHATSRGATVLAEVLGFGTNCDGAHITSPSSEGMEACMRLALSDAGLTPADIDYVNAHATATDVGDIAESVATRAVFGTRTAVSSTKAHTGHTLGACGALETAFCLRMMHDGFVAPTRNLDHIDTRCAELDYVTEPREQTLNVVMNNNFAFGGVNTSLVLGKGLAG